MRVYQHFDRLIDDWRGDWLRGSFRQGILNSRLGPFAHGFLIRLDLVDAIADDSQCLDQVRFQVVQHFSGDEAAHVRARGLLRRGREHDEVVVVLAIEAGFHINASSS